MELFKVKKLSELLEWSRQPAPQEPDRWLDKAARRLLPFLFKEENYWRQEAAKRQSELLAMIQACEDAGRIGLALYAENEILRQRADLEEGRKFVPSSDLDAAKREIVALQGKLKSMTERHNNMCQEHDLWLQRFWAQDQ